MPFLKPRNQTQFKTNPDQLHPDLGKNLELRKT